MGDWMVSTTHKAGDQVPGVFGRGKCIPQGRRESHSNDNRHTDLNIYSLQSHRYTHACSQHKQQGGGVLEALPLATAGVFLLKTLLILTKSRV